MKREISIQPPATTLNPLKDATGVTSVDVGTQFDGLVKKMTTYKMLLKKEKRKAV